MLRVLGRFAGMKFLRIFHRPRAVPGRWLAGCALLLAPAVWAQLGPVLTHAEGSLALAPAGDREWIEVRPRRPVYSGERLWTDRGSRAELQVYGHSLRLAGGTQLAIASGRPASARFTVTQGSLIARIGPLASGEHVEIDTPNLALRATQPGLYRLDIDAKAATTRVSVQEGVVRVWGQRGETLDLPAGRQASFSGRALVPAEPARPLAQDDFDRWSLARDQRGGHPATARAGNPALQVLGAQPAAAPGRVPAPRVAAQRTRPQAPPAGRAVAAQREAQARRASTAAAPTPQRAAVEHWQRDQENWLRYNHGLPPLPATAPGAAAEWRRAG
jgi:hypothetical protein